MVGLGTVEGGTAADGTADAGTADAGVGGGADIGGAAIGGAVTGEDSAAGGTDEPHPTSSRTSPPVARTRATTGTGTACQFQQRRT
jgi:hypothetical protein